MLKKRIYQTGLETYVRIKKSIGGVAGVIGVVLCEVLADG